MRERLHNNEQSSAPSGSFALGSAPTFCALFIFLAAFVLASGSTITRAAEAEFSPNFAAFTLRRDENWSPLATEDLNGDGRKDLVYGVYSEGGGRELLVHYQDASGGFSQRPQRIEIKSEIIGIGFAELRPEPGIELLLYAANGVFSLSAGIEGYAGNLRPLLQADALATIASNRSVELMPALEDQDADGMPDLLLPRANGFAFYRGAEPGFAEAGNIATVNDALALARRNNREAGLDARLGINAQDGLAIEFAVERANPFDDFVRIWQPRSNKSENENEDGEQPADILNSEKWIPNALLRNLNGDARMDLAFVNLDAEANPQLNIAYQSPKGFAEDRIWSGSLAGDDGRGERRLVDLDGDGLADFLRLSGEGDEWEVRLHRNRLSAGEESVDIAPFILDTPDQILRLRGYDLRVEALQIGSGETVLAVSFYTLPVVDAIRSASINRTQLLYAAAEQDQTQQGLLFERRPASQLSESFSAANVRGLSEQMSLRYDIDNDGRKDALYVTESGTLAAKRIDSSLTIADEPFWEYTSNSTVFEFEVKPLNDDSTPDLILRHGTTITVLVSRND